MKAFSMSVFAMSLAVSASAFAANPGNNSMTLEGLKNKCTELSANDQLKPFKAVVTCKQVATEWRPSATPVEPIQVENMKQIGASFSLKGYAVPFQAEDVEAPAAQAACTILEQYKLTVPAVDIELDCAGLQAVTKLADLCGPAIDERVTADPSIQIVEPTGVTFNSCQH